jgi:hypothetical protein
VTFCTIETVITGGEMNRDIDTVKAVVEGEGMNGTMEALCCSQQLKFLLQVEI